MSPVLRALAKQYRVTLVKPDHEEDPSSVVPAIYLLFDMETQRRTKWCWAATSASISGFYDPASVWTQCSVVRKALGGILCCTWVLGWSCNRFYYLDKALTLTSNFAGMSGIMNFDAVAGELWEGRVIGARVAWRGGNGHFMAIHGCGTGETMNVYCIDDPVYGKSSIAEKVLLTNYEGRGGWSHSYHTKP